MKVSSRRFRWVNISGLRTFKKDTGVRGGGAMGKPGAPHQPTPLLTRNEMS